ncbi:hypothetical protein SRA_07761 [Streptococcus ratti FA-1 = DSM 20564]|uniref:Uncharacterized protein n=1 Tax=Streptococcus ratti FA-1 = DSM 20564 TaxID=699248 RepID=A0ABP2QZG9_STRRT|nr:hypothetical protein SRA_07761 [Streptococcus ratti FA-1 = DSM 20564]
MLLYFAAVTAGTFLEESALKYTIDYIIFEQ